MSTQTQGRADRPARPTLSSSNQAPVMVKQPPPFTVRMSQFLWVLSFFAGAASIIYYFVIREDQNPLILEAIRTVDGTRPLATYESAADILYWSAFGAMVVMLGLQITLLVNFMTRRPGTRWWQLGSLLVQAVAFALAIEVVAGGEQGLLLRQLLAAQCALVLLALVFAIFPGAIAWTARKYDVRRGSVSGEAAGGEF